MTTALTMTTLLFAFSASPTPDAEPSGRADARRPAAPALGSPGNDAARQEVFGPSVEPALAALSRLRAEAGTKPPSERVATDIRLGGLYAGPPHPLGPDRRAAPAPTRIVGVGAAFAHYDAPALRRADGSGRGSR
jgi:hypothetical protein